MKTKPHRLLMFGLAVLLMKAAWALEVTGSASPQEGPPPLLVRFACSTQGQAGKLTYRWRFGDKATASVQNPTHTYARIGNFQAAVEVSDRSGSRSWTTTIRVALKETVTVGAEGGAASVRFRADSGQRLRIRLQADPGMEPYGYLESASGGNDYPANGAGHDGANAWEGTAPDTGEYVLTVFDGSNRGGRVAVTVDEP